MSDERRSVSARPAETRLSRFEAALAVAAREAIAARARKRRRLTLIGGNDHRRDVA